MHNQHNINSYKQMKYTYNFNNKLIIIFRQKTAPTSVNLPSHAPPNNQRSFFCVYCLNIIKKFPIRGSNPARQGENLVS